MDRLFDAQVTLSGAPVQQETGLQRAGDVNNEDTIDIGDFSLARAALVGLAVIQASTGEPT